MWLRVCREKNARVGARDAESTGRVVLSFTAAQPGREISPGGGGCTTLSGGSRSGEISEFQGGRQGRVSDENDQGNAGAHRALIPDSSERSLAHVTHQTNPGPLSTPPLTPQSVSAPAPLPRAQPDVGAGTLTRSLCAGTNALGPAQGVNCACPGHRSVTFKETEGRSRDAAYRCEPMGPWFTVSQSLRRSNQKVPFYYLGASFSSQQQRGVFQEFIQLTMAASSWSLSSEEQPRGIALSTYFTHCQRLTPGKLASSLKTLHQGKFSFEQRGGYLRAGARALTRWVECGGFPEKQTGHSWSCRVCFVSSGVWRKNKCKSRWKDRERMV